MIVLVNLFIVVSVHFLRIPKLHVALMTFYVSEGGACHHDDNESIKKPKHLEEDESVFCLVSHRKLDLKCTVTEIINVINLRF